MIIYSYFSLVMGIIFALIALLMLISLFKDRLGPKFAFFLFFIACALISFGAFHSAFDKPNPTKDDVMDSNAVYQETQIIKNGDTIKLYDIVWKEE